MNWKGDLCGRRGHGVCALYRNLDGGSEENHENGFLGQRFELGTSRTPRRTGEHSTVTFSKEKKKTVPLELYIIFTIHRNRIAS
jgi:hypothetical protein